MTNSSDNRLYYKFNLSPIVDEALEKKKYLETISRIQSDKSVSGAYAEKGDNSVDIWVCGLEELDRDYVDKEFREDWFKVESMEEMNREDWQESISGPLEYF